ncbi:hypothetical protein TC41_1906 [Alicyclobacillus acidocaldarius subsp. acidocaldarius Tc-4-1]|uniref:Uncharacterized protein n=1 Tax=Alicyclobacillus acidocaldarius (strain Tc-4-1) TaxID=1048834 RepID=F8IDG8_ALIAT|nr:hypothetical protein TC41_1906 [Alicyclobacillus acidocaldarius subsp. acidocaldarius Tc-4-1]
MRESLRSELHRRPEPLQIAPCILTLPSPKEFAKRARLPVFWNLSF